jgi:hypothetical protein
MMTVDGSIQTDHALSPWNASLCQGTVVRVPIMTIPIAMTAVGMPEAEDPIAPITMTDMQEAEGPITTLLTGTTSGKIMRV